jgi:hypothetical protein
VSQVLGLGFQGTMEGRLEGMGGTGAWFRVFGHHGGVPGGHGVAQVLSDSMEQWEQHVQPCIASNCRCCRVAPPPPLARSYPGPPLPWVQRCQAAYGTATYLCRPPGHHAERDRGLGFCVCNNIVVAAAHTMAAQGASQ